MNKINYFKALLVIATFMAGTFSAWSQETAIYSTGFESADSFTASTSYNNVTELFAGATGKQWGVYYGTPSTTSPIADTQSMQMRWYTSSTTSLGYAYTNFNLAKVTKVTFKAANTSGINVIVSYSTNGGSTYTGAQTFTLSTSSNLYTYNVSATGAYPGVRLKFQLTYTTAPTATSRLYIDDVTVYGMSSVTDVRDISQKTGISTSNGNILFSGTSGESVEVYSVSGQKLVHTTAVEGLNKIPVSVKGVVLVKVADRISKVIL